MNDQLKTVTLADVLPEVVANLRAGRPMAEHHAAERRRRIAELRAAGIPEHDLPEAPADPDTIRAIRARKDRP